MNEEERTSEPVIWLDCACCGSGVRGRQWCNRDDGYGVCLSCADENTARYGEGKPGDGLGGSTTYALYGRRGYHFGVDETEAGG